jgi:excinuclease ABC subunit B
MKAVRDLTDDIARQRQDMAVAEERGAYTTTATLPAAELNRMVQELEKQMKEAAQALEFEKAAVLRDQIMELRQLKALKEAGTDPDMPEWERLRKLDEAGIMYEVGD